jgi:hypothetical protein
MKPNGFLIGISTKALDITGKPSAEIMEGTALPAETPCKPGRGENKYQEIKGI